MIKIVGYIPMQKRKGAIVFTVNDSVNGVHGKSVEKLFVYEDLADKITDSVIGRECEVAYGCGYSGKAYISDITIK